MILASFVKFACVAAVALTPAAPAAAQTAYEINRLNQAVQICNSPMGAGLAECAKLRGHLGMGAPSVGGLGGGPGVGGLGLGGGKGAAAAGILGALGSAMSARQAPAAAPAAPAANANAIAGCVRNAAGDTAMIQACLSAASAPRPAAPSLGYAQQGVPALGQALLPSAQRNHDTAMGIHQAGQNYHACVAADPNNWRACLPLMNGGQPR